MAKVVEQLLQPPDSATEAARLNAFLGESWRPLNWRLDVPLLLALLGLRRVRKSDLLPLSPETLSARFFDMACSAVPATRSAHDERAIATIASAFGWADALGARYAQIFRGAYSMNFLFAALAVFATAASLIASHVLGWEKWPFVVAEIAFVVTVILNTAAGRRRDWHGRWLETREVAERLRAGWLQWLVGLNPTAFAGDELTWAGWYVRAHLRALGLHSAMFDERMGAACAKTIGALVDDQRRYHAATVTGLETVERRLERIGDTLFVLTLAVAVAYLAGVAWGVSGSALVELRGDRPHGGIASLRRRRLWTATHRRLRGYRKPFATHARHLARGWRCSEGRAAFTAGAAFACAYCGGCNARGRFALAARYRDTQARHSRLSAPG